MSKKETSSLAAGSTSRYGTSSRLLVTISNVVLLIKLVLLLDVSSSTPPPPHHGVVVVEGFSPATPGPSSTRRSSSARIKSRASGCINIVSSPSRQALSSSKSSYSSLWAVDDNGASAVTAGEEGSARTTTTLVGAALADGDVPLTSSSSLPSSQVSPVPSSLEDALVMHATPLEASPDRSAAAHDLLTKGVCRINRVVPETDCSALRRHVVATLRRRAADHREAAAYASDLRHIPGTRLRFGEPLAVPLNGHRTDLLLPLEDDAVSNVLQRLADELGDILLAGATGGLLPVPPTPPTPTPPDAAGETATATSTPLELVEAACLISEPGASHQDVHADFRRDANRPSTRLDPRIVAFLYLQDAPTPRHGPTVFVPSTNTPDFHDAYYNRHYEHNHNDDDNNNNSKSIHHINNQSHSNSRTDLLLRAGPRCATLGCGDVAIYDASVLHFGSANTVPDNTRVVLYFGVAAAAADSNSDSNSNIRTGGDGDGNKNNTVAASAVASLETLPPISLVIEEAGESIVKSDHSQQQSGHDSSSSNNNNINNNNYNRNGHSGQSSPSSAPATRRRYYWRHPSIKGLARS